MNTVRTVGKCLSLGVHSLELPRKGHPSIISWKLLRRANFFRVEGSVGTFVRTDDSTICRAYASYGIIEGSETDAASKNRKRLTSTKLQGVHKRMGEIRKNCSSIFKNRSETLRDQGHFSISRKIEKKSFVAN